MKQKTLEDFILQHLENNSKYLMSGILVSEWKDICERYANYKAGIAFKEGCEAQRIKCADNAEAEDNSDSPPSVDKESILNCPLADNPYSPENTKK